MDVVGIANLALLSVGARNYISSLTDGSTESNAVSTLFDFVYEQLARTARWNCLQKQSTLSLLAAAQGTPENPTGTTMPLPPTPWLYTYAYPSDCLAMRYIVPSYPSSSSSGTPATTYNNSAATWLPSGGQIPFQVAYSTDTSGNPIQVIYTNQDIAQAVYTVNQPNPIIWDSLFQAAMVSSLAAYLVPALSLNNALMQSSIKAAENHIAVARAQDANEGVTVVDHQPDWISARGTIPGNWGWNGGNVNAAYSSMAWPY